MTRKTTERPQAEVLLEEEDAEPSSDLPEPEQILDVGATLPSISPPPERSVPAIRSRSGLRRSGALERFLAEMGRYPLLTLEEEQDLTLRVFKRQDPVAARKLVVHNLRLVVKMAYKYRRTWTNVLDLIQEGNLGLVDAVGRFDPFKGARFSTYATYWIRAYILRYLLEHARTVRISRTRVGRKLFFQLSKEREKLRAQGIEPHTKLLAERLGVDSEELEEVARYMDQTEVQLDAPTNPGDGESGAIVDGFSDGQASPETLAVQNELSQDVNAALRTFAETLKDDRERALWKKHLLAEEPESLSELGGRFGVTKQRMGQIATQMKKRLRIHLVETLGPDIELGFNLDVD